MSHTEYEGNPIDDEMLDDNADAQPDDGSLESAIEAALRVEIAALQERLLRMAADLENTRRRAEREKADAGRYAIQGFARDLLPVADNFERALAAAPAEAVVSAAGLEGLLTGLRMSERELVVVLERHGVRRIDPSGERFDPNLHQAVGQIPAAGVPAGHVAITAQTGFILGDRVLRAAMVFVSSGEPEASPAPDGASPLGGAVDAVA